MYVKIYAIYARLANQNSMKLRVFERKLEGNTPLFNNHLDPIFRVNTADEVRCVLKYMP